MSFQRVSRLVLPLVLAVSTVSGAALAQGQPTQAEKTLKYRKALYQVIVYKRRADERHGAGQDAVQQRRLRDARHPRGGTGADARRVLLA